MGIMQKIKDFDKKISDTIKVSDDNPIKNYVNKYVFTIVIFCLIFYGIAALWQNGWNPQAYIVTCSYSFCENPIHTCASVPSHYKKATEPADPFQGMMELRETFPCREKVSDRECPNGVCNKFFLYEGETHGSVPYLMKNTSYYATLIVVVGLIINQLIYMFRRKK